MLGLKTVVGRPGSNPTVKILGHPKSVQTKSSIRGIGYLSSLEALFTVSLKSPQIRTDFLSAFSTGTIGAAILHIVQAL